MAVPKLVKDGELSLGLFDGGGSIELATVAFDRIPKSNKQNLMLVILLSQFFNIKVVRAAPRS